MRRLNRFVAAALTVLALSHRVQADVQAQERAQAQLSAWSDIVMKDLDRLTKRAEIYHHLPEDKAKGYLGQRAVFALFESSHPTILALSERWVKEQPDSPYAHAARGWTLLHIGFLARGGATIRDTYPDALALADRYFDEAMVEAERAYTLAPDLVAASDLFIVAGMVATRPRPLDEVLAEVMAQTPSRGTLQRAANALSPRWGGSIEAVFALCDRYAATVPDVQGYTVDVCKADLLQETNFSAADRSVVAGIVAASDHPLLKPARILQKIQAADTSAAFQEELEAYLFDTTVTDTHAAQYLDLTFYLPQQRPMISVGVWMRKLSEAWDKFDRDPANYWLMSDLTVEAIGDQPIRPRLGATERFVMNRDALALAPYEPGLWATLAGLSGNWSRDRLRQRNALYENSIVYSNHSGWALTAYANVLAWDFSLLSMARTSGDGSFAGIPAGDYSDDTEDLLCPFARATRLYALRCQAGEADPERCTYDFASKEWSGAADAINAGGLCATELQGDPETLMFQGHAVDLSKLLGPGAN